MVYCVGHNATQGVTKAEGLQGQMIVHAAPSMYSPDREYREYLSSWERPSYFFLLAQPSVGRIDWKLSYCSYLLLFRGTAAPGAWPRRLSRLECLGGDALTGIVCTTRTHQEHLVQDWRPIFWPPPPSQTQLRGGRCPESVGRQGLKTCELMLWSFKPSQHAAHTHGTQQPAPAVSIFEQCHE